MAATPSTMVALGTTAPAFTLIDVTTGDTISLASHPGEHATVIMFICNHCPYVKHIRQRLVEVANHYQQQGIRFIAISANDAAQYPEDGPEQMKATAKQWGFSFPYCYDETQEVARAYDAACTPDFFVYDKQLNLVYRGQFDDARPKNNLPVTGNDLSAALDALLTGMPVSPDQKPSIGCNIKWKD
ncbi:MAG: thioredoxin family protein [Cyclobacteriaceae bacterium]|jgi:peroxiredoxin|nr:thioredoxin family protein [Cyclobacteriaceae bacterium]